MMRALSLFACGALLAVCLCAVLKDYGDEVLTCRNIGRHDMRFVTGTCQDTHGRGIWVHGDITAGGFTNPATVVEIHPR